VLSKEHRARHGRAGSIAAVWIVILVAGLTFAPTLMGDGPPPAEPTPSEAATASLGRAALAQLEGGFTENAGQVSNKEVLYTASAGGMDVGFAESAVLFHVGPRRAAPSSPARPLGEAAPAATVDTRGSVLLRLTFEGSRPVAPRGEEALPYRSNYFLGNDPSTWRTDVRSYRNVVYEGLYEGIDLVYRIAPEGVKYEFLAAPYSDIAAIRIHYEGPEAIEMDGKEMVLRTTLGELRDSPPVAYEKGGRVIPCAFLPREPRSFGFQCEGWDASRALVVDPLVYSTFLGGGSFESSHAVAVDSSGNTYVTGLTGSADFPATPGVFDTTLNSIFDAFVVKLNASGTGLVYATFLGGGLDDSGSALAVDSSGNVYVAGFTGSADFPATPGSFDTTLGGTLDSFVVKLNASGTGLVYGTFLGGGSYDEVLAVAVDSSGSAYVTGFTRSTDFPATPGSFDTTYNGSSDAFAVKLNGAGTRLLYGTFLGGGLYDYGHALTVGASGNASVAGRTNSPDFPITPGAFDTTFNGGGNDAFVVRLNATGAGLVYATFLGGSSDDYAYGLAVDEVGNAYVTGTTDSPDFPASPGAYDTAINGAFDAFVVKLNVTGTGLRYGTFLGGGSDEYGNGLDVDAFGDAYVAGDTHSADFPITPGAFDPTFNGGSNDAFVVQLNATGTGLLYGTFLGGVGNDWSSAVAVDASGNAYVFGETYSTDFPVTSGAHDTSVAGRDAFVAKIDVVSISVRISLPPDGSWMSTTTVPLAGTAADSGGGGLDRVEVSCDGGATWNLAVGTASWTFGCIGLVPGANLLHARAFDLAGWESVHAVVTLNVDLLPPVITFASPVAQYTNQDVVVTYTVTDTPDPTPTITGPASGTVYTTEGSQTITITATDDAGNIATATVTFTIDKTPPGVTMTCPAEAKLGTTASCTVTVTNDRGPPTVSWVVARDKATVARGNGTLVTFTATVAGTYAVTVTATDAAGNTATASKTIVAPTPSDPLVPILLLLLATVASLVFFLLWRRKKPEDAGAKEPQPPTPLG